MSYTPGIGGPPSGPAGGGLGGTYPNPSVQQLKSVIVSGTAPTAGQVLTASDATHAAWASPAAGLAVTERLNWAQTLDSGAIALTQNVNTVVNTDIPTFTTVGGKVFLFAQHSGSIGATNPDAAILLQIDGARNFQLTGMAGMTAAVFAGAAIEIPDLAPGVHTITLQAFTTDAADNYVCQAASNNNWQFFRVQIVELH